MFWLIIPFFIFSVIYLGVCEANLFEFEVHDSESNIIPLSIYKDAKVILIVNTASNCGFTYTNYKELGELYDKYHKRGLEILAFPSNQFGEMEPGNDREIQTFVRNYGVQFPVFAKINVNGPKAHPVYKFLKSNSDNTEVGWNFEKFLVVRGVPYRRYHSRTTPKKIIEDFLKFLEPESESEL